MSKLLDLASTMIYIAGSLRQLDAIVSGPQCANCAKYGVCEYAPGWGETTRYNCPLWEKEDNT